MRNPAVVSVGANPLDSSRWIEPDDHFDDYIKNKEQLFSRDPSRVLAALPESQDAQIELGKMLARHISNNPFYPENQKTLVNNIEPPQDIWQCSLSVQDDLCLLEEINGYYVLTAASLCAPSEWDLREKIGRPIHEIHAPVPGLNKAIGTQIHHMMSRLSPIRPLERFNWSIKDDPRLALFPDRTPFDDSNQLYLRVERQTLTRLPQSHAVAFTIRIYIYPLEQLVPVPNALQSLKSAIDQLSPQEVQYKAIAPIYSTFKRFCKLHIN